MSDPGLNIQARRARFAALHEKGCFLLPNPWDPGSARYLESLGFPAIATTSAGFAWSQARPDNGVTRDQVLAHLATMVAAVSVPVNADFEGGFAHDPDGVAENVTMALETGVAGLSIEDSTGDPTRPLYELEAAAARIRAARRAVDRSGGSAVLVARAECFLVGRPDLGETLARLQAYAQAGADCLYAPGLRRREHIEAVVSALSPKPLNVLVGSSDGLSVAELAALGVRRISVGGALARVAWGSFIRAARLLARDGSFAGFADAAPGADLDDLFKTH